MNTADFKQLYDRYVNNTCSPEEAARFLVAAAGREEEVTALMEGTWNSLEVYPGQYSLTATALPVETPVRRIGWLRYAAAAAILFAVAIGSYMLTRKEAPKDLAKTTQTERFKNDLAPGTTGAILTLSDGTQVVLDTASNGFLAIQGASNVSKQAEGLVYKSTTTPNSEPQTPNTLSTPRGRQYSLQLADGTRVWLNAGSSITYPTAFVGNTRAVSITGEAYFEVAKAAAKPFIVSVSTPSGMSTQVEVLGTHFNINAYEDDGAIRTTLLEGKVRLHHGESIGILAPGQQAVLTGSNKFDIKEGADLSEVMAWKNGLFSFGGASIKNVMSQLARWYDVEVVYEGDVKETFYVKMNRNTKASNVFKILETTGGVHFRIDGRKVTVLP